MGNRPISTAKAIRVRGNSILLVLSAAEAATVRGALFAAAENAVTKREGDRAWLIRMRLDDPQ